MYRLRVITQSEGQNRENGAWVYEPALPKPDAKIRKKRTHHTLRERERQRVMKGKSARKPLRDVSNNNNNGAATTSSKSLNLKNKNNKKNEKKKMMVMKESENTNDETLKVEQDNALDHLLLVQSHLSSLLHQVPTSTVSISYGYFYFPFNLSFRNFYRTNPIFSHIQYFLLLVDAFRIRYCFTCIANCVDAYILR